MGARMLKSRLLDARKVAWEALDRFEDRTVFQTREWVQYVAETQNAQPILAELRDGSEVVGYFTGLTLRKFGVRILGSSFPGWATPYMGFNLLPGFSRTEALAAIEAMAFGELKCLHMEVSDRHFTVENGAQLGFVSEFYTSYQTDLRQPEEKIFNSMTSACRRCIRKAEKSGVTVEQAHDLGFADDFYEQLKDVFAKQGLVPTYDVHRVRVLIKHLEPTGHLLLLRARDSQGKCIGTGVFPGFNKVAQFWGNASFRSSQILRPNEAIQWYAMRYWKARGIETYDWGGGGSYKEKYGCVPLSVPWFCKSRYKLLSMLRETARTIVASKQRLHGWWKAERNESRASSYESSDE